MHFIYFTVNYLEFQPVIILGFLLCARVCVCVPLNCINNDCFQTGFLDAPHWPLVKKQTVPDLMPLVEPILLCWAGQRNRNVLMLPQCLQWKPAQWLTCLCIFNWDRINMGLQKHVVVTLHLPLWPGQDSSRDLQHYSCTVRGASH